MFGWKRKAKDAEKKVLDLTYQIVRLQTKVNENHLLRQDKQKAEAELSAMRREQTEADLLLISARIICGILQRKTLAELQPLISQQEALQRQMSGLGPVSFSNSPFTGLQNILGLNL